MTKRTIHRCAQQSDEWGRLHIATPTAGNFHRILTADGKKSRSWNDYLYRLVAERLLNEYLPQRPDTEARESRLYWADRGIQMEPIAIRAFEQQLGLMFEPVGFIQSPMKKLGCSPDGMVVGKNECIEIKSPAPWTQLKYLLEGPGKDYKPQVQGQMLVGDFERVHFFAFHPRMPAKHVPTEPDLPYTLTLMQALDDFLGELDAQTERARELGIFKSAEEILGSASLGSGERGGGEAAVQGVHDGGLPEELLPSSPPGSTSGSGVPGDG